MDKPEEKAIKLLANCAKNSRAFSVSSHVNADAALCAFLIELGYKDVVTQYNLVTKKYL